eukprot:Blabericola_migrator_1__7511@NODE_3838_length_1477_cov_4_651064_g2379_i0_p1_GENE_NODE_3838_length_1477_cov_4_651064_g2379_i0NODE_3838_length_1477_cov_4_651064_g2379_i0_p1_ORF_typecomplete_len156_score0_29_NODE_3838_length_1477_cov_4_651064_g2379_i0275742
MRDAPSLKLILLYTQKVSERVQCVAWGDRSVKRGRAMHNSTCTSLTLYGELPWSSSEAAHKVPLTKRACARYSFQSTSRLRVWIIAVGTRGTHPALSIKASDSLLGPVGSGGRKRAHICAQRTELCRTSKSMLVGSSSLTPVRRLNDEFPPPCRL